MIYPQVHRISLAIPLFIFRRVSDIRLDTKGRADTMRGLGAESEQPDGVRLEGVRNRNGNSLRILVGVRSLKNIRVEFTVLTGQLVCRIPFLTMKK